ncbi:hypothetical protein P43SY_002759 [Pythium insidiosum]|uniref:C2 NT-type domain-containing protein n=1 Tax=Pythium insidiosum TaxID=114742 RepID=A0AAD5QB47_PYTIN|nr:hypothetical protein P43SY_002759 [Pythium insidiosum]
MSRASASLPVADARRVVFDVRVVVHGCSNVPHQPNARVFCKWKLLAPHGGATAGVIPPADVTRSNLVLWDAVLDLSGLTMKLNKATQTVRPCVLRLSVRQESRASMKGYVRLGVVHVDVGEFAGQPVGERTFLLEKSRLNSTLSVTVQAAQIGGDVMFRRRSTVTTATPSLDSGAESSGSPRCRGRSLPTTIGQSFMSSRGSSSSVFQVVDDILRISEGTRTSRHSTQSDAALP